MGYTKYVYTIAIRQNQKTSSAITGFSIPSASSAAQERDFDGLENDQQIQAERHVLDVIEVVSQLLDVIFERCAIAAMNLCPAGRPWLHGPALRVERDFAHALLL